MTEDHICVYRGGMLSIKLLGNLRGRRVLAIIQKLLKEHPHDDSFKIIFDFSELNQNLSPAETCLLTTYLARFEFPDNHRLAFVVSDSEKNEEFAQLIEFCLSQEGIDMNYFYNEALALRWLQKKNSNDEQQQLSA